MVFLYIFCGLPGSGKTTMSKKIAEEQNLVRLSFDELGCLQHKELINPILEALKDNKSVVVDALFYRTIQRDIILQAMKNIDCKKILIYMNTPLEECIRRNKERSSHQLPDDFIRAIYNSIQIPTLDEGWDEIIYY